MTKKNDSYSKGIAGEQEAELIFNTIFPEAEIIKRNFITDPVTGVPREIDLDIKTYDKKDIKVEVRKRSAKSQVDWIDQIQGKYKYIDYDSIYAFSNSDFTSDAIKQAFPNVKLNLLRNLTKPIDEFMKEDDFAFLFENSKEIIINSYNCRIDESTICYVNADKTQGYKSKYKISVLDQLKSNITSKIRQEPEKKNGILSLKEVPVVFEDGSEGFVEIRANYSYEIFASKFKASMGSVVKNVKSGKVIAYLLKFEKAGENILIVIYNIESNTFLLMLDLQNSKLDGEFLSGYSFTTPRNFLGVKELKSILKIRLQNGRFIGIN